MTSFSAFVADAAAQGELVVQPRMGFADPAQMRAGLLAVRGVRGRTAGTITLDSYTRVGAHDAARRALRDGAPLNGFPLVAHGPDVTRKMLEGVVAQDFPVQVRHGSPAPYDIVRTLLDAGLDATEGGPVSYCLPYSRTPLRDSVREWRRTCELMGEHGPHAHLETFGGCMLGQLCPPGLLVALSVLEALFFRAHGLRSVSLSYAQQTEAAQDLEAIAALRTLAGELLPDVRWHVVLYTYMGVYPRSTTGATTLLRDSVELAVRSGAERLIVKTEVEAHRIPTTAENVAAVRRALDATGRPIDDLPPSHTGVLVEARALVEAVLELHADLGRALELAFQHGWLDVPYCLHPDNAGETRAALDERGRLRWVSVGSMPISGLVRTLPPEALSARSLLTMLTHVERRYDNVLDDIPARLHLTDRRE
ncbi:methylaspartate mutase [Saccharothrix sp. S26]|uniref:methylaspartate mutase n=1 Tax=Saccharothrix sp. S26 TaxID=2907215 RepID=UPI001F1C50CB|nr:methylaspartate mutase [Saccharothrix sp. S26]MCE7001185.1 methylaspartate mutase [Saccharothrix sp. S26]